jgi:hypothetical protein
MNVTLVTTLMALCVSACHPGGIAGDSQPRTTEQAMKKTLSNTDSGYSSTPADWTAFLTCWGAKFGMKIAQAEKLAGPRIPSDLPPSYRHFVQATGGRGWQLPGEKSRSGDGQLVPLVSLGLLKNGDRATWRAWNENRLSTRISDKDYYDYSRKQDPTKFRDQHLDALILVGTLGHGSVVVLNPAEKSRDGEWEAWYLSTKLAGALRFRSFAELIQMLYFADLRPENDLWSYTDAERESSCAGTLRIHHR